MDQPAEAEARPTRKKSPAERWVKLAFALAFLGAVVIVGYLQLRGPMLGWPGDLEAALAEARASVPPRKVLVFVRDFPVSKAGTDMVKGTLSKPTNRKAMADYVKAELTLDRDAPWARKYGVTKTPTMLIISADGERFHKQAGSIGEMEFLKEFLAAPLEPVGGTP